MYSCLVKNKSDGWKMLERWHSLAYGNLLRLDHTLWFVGGFSRMVSSEDPRQRYFWQWIWLSLQQLGRWCWSCDSAHFQGDRSDQISGSPGLAVEFDMYRNPDLGELSGNHISVHVPPRKGHAGWSRTIISCWIVDFWSMSILNK